MEKFHSTVLLPWPYDYQVTTAAWETGLLYVGTSSGYIYRFNSTDLKKTILEIPQDTLLLSSKQINEIHLMSNCLLAFCDNKIFNVTKNLSQNPKVEVKSVSAICEKSVSNAKPQVGDDMRFFAVASKQSISIYKFDMFWEFVRAIPVSSSHIISLCWVNNVIAYVSKTGYYTIDINTLNENCILNVLDDSHLLALSPAMNDEIMIICQNNIGIFYDLKADRVSNRNTIPWKPQLVEIGNYPPFMIGVSSDGLVEIYGIRTQQLYQTMHVGNFKKLIFLKDQNFVISTTDTALFGFYSGDYYAQLSSLFVSKKIKEAFELFNIYSQNDENYLARSQLFHLSAGLVYFDNLEFARAFQHFTLGPPDLNYLLNFWSDYITPVDYQLDIPYGLDSLAPKPIPISDFIKSRFKEAQTNLDEQTLKALADCCLSSFLLQQRKQMRSLDQMKRIDTLCFMLLSESDDKRYQLFCHPDRFLNYIDTDMANEFLKKIGKHDIVAELLFGTGDYISASEIISTIEIDNHKIEMLYKCIIEMADSIEQSGKIHSSRTGREESIQLKPFSSELLSRIEYYLTIMLKNVELRPDLVKSIFKYRPIFVIFTIDQVLAILTQAKSSDHFQLVSEIITHFLEAFVASDVPSLGKEEILASHYLENAINGQRREIDQLLVFVEKNVNQLFAWLEKVYSNQIVNFSKIKSCTIFQKEIIAIASNGVLGNHSDSIRDIINMDYFPSKEIMLESYSLCYYSEPGGNKPFLTNRAFWIEMAILPIKCFALKNISDVDIFHQLLKQLLDANMDEFAYKLLDKYARTQVFDPLQVLKILPDDMELAKVSKYFLHAYKIATGHINMSNIQLGLELSK